MRLAATRLAGCAIAGLALLALPGSALAGWKLALPGWRYEFPRDHGNHPGFKTEWWYFTGNLRARDGPEFGYQLTFFRHGITPASERIEAASRFVTGDVKFAHFAVTDGTDGTDGTDRKFLFRQFLSRGAFGEAGFGDGDRLAWIEDCALVLDRDGTFHLTGRDAEKAIDLRLRPARAPVVHGAEGVSRKADGKGRASHYYSITRLETSGTLTLGGRTFAVGGLSWFDHEWATNQLAAGQTGWDWFSLQFDDGSDLMLFQIRTEKGGRDRWSGGTFVDARGAATAISNDDFTLDPVATWKSPGTGAAYPVRWRLAIPKLGLEIEVTARAHDQELLLAPIAYWEGAVRAAGTRDGSAITGAGYLEMTGYAGGLIGVKAPGP